MGSFIVSCCMHANPYTTLCWAVLLAAYGRACCRVPVVVHRWTSLVLLFSPSSVSLFNLKWFSVAASIFICAVSTFCSIGKQSCVAPVCMGLIPLPLIHTYTHTSTHTFSYRLSKSKATIEPMYVRQVFCYGCRLFLVFLLQFCCSQFYSSNWCFQSKWSHARFGIGYCYSIAIAFAIEIDFRLHAWHGNDNDNCTDIIEFTITYNTKLKRKVLPSTKISPSALQKRNWLATRVTSPMMPSTNKKIYIEQYHGKLLAQMKLHACSHNNDAIGKRKWFFYCIIKIAD